MIQLLNFESYTKKLLLVKKIELMVYLIATLDLKILCNRYDDQSLIFLAYLCTVYAFSYTFISAVGLLVDMEYSTTRNLRVSSIICYTDGYCKAQTSEGQFKFRFTKDKDCEDLVDDNHVLTVSRYSKLPMYLSTNTDVDVY